MNRFDHLDLRIPIMERGISGSARGILEQTSGDPLKLSEMLILLPSRRACRTLREAFLRLSEGKPLLLPRMQPVGDVDADEVALLLAAEEDAADVLDIPPAISKLERQLLLAISAFINEQKDKRR